MTESIKASVKIPVVNLFFALKLFATKLTKYAPSAKSIDLRQPTQLSLDRITDIG